MKRPLITSIAAVFLLFSTSVLNAGGSINISDLNALLGQQPALWKFYSEHFDISPHGGGLRLSSQGIPLRGCRVGPYEFPAKLKGAIGGYDLKLTIITDLYFLDSRGKEVTDQKLATKKEEVLTGISLGPFKAPGRDGSFVQSSD